jgi:aminoglycoside phosphotransferase (APT) family kinase protein
MGDDRIDIAPELVRSLIAEQFPHWAHLHVRPVALDGWDNHTFHLGDDMKVRMPSAARYVAQVEKENLWLPKLAPRLPLPVPVPIAVGRPGPGYAWPWSVYKWLAGETASRDRIADLNTFAADLANFLLALRRIDASDGPPAGAHNFFRGGPLATYDEDTRNSITLLGDRIDGAGAREVWEAALASQFTGPPVWIHGDIAVGNLLVENGKLSAVIDFGGIATGDPACDLVISWVFLDAESRKTFRNALGLDAGTWARARGWAIWKAMRVTVNTITLNPAETPALRVVETVIAEHRALSAQEKRHG